jgi:diacylglycerol kinase family enzyme
MKHVFVFDSKAFFNQQWKMDNILDSIGQFFRTQEKPDYSIQYSRYRRNAMLIIQEAVEKTEPGEVVRFYAIGGEEILFDCFNGAAHYPNTQLAAVPYGETNDFIKIFGDSKVEAFKDIPALVKAGTLPTDAIRWGINYTLNACYIGINTAFMQQLKSIKANLNKGNFMLFTRLSSVFNYLLTAFKKNLAWRKYNIAIDDADYSGRYSLIHVANGPYHYGRKTGAAEATPDDGLMDITLIKSSNPLTTLLALRKYSRGGKPKNCVCIQAKKITIKSDEQMWIQLDNEFILDNNISLSVIPRAVNMVALDNLSYPLASIAAV